jgi:hypothetical protein
MSVFRGSNVNHPADADGEWSGDPFDGPTERLYDPERVVLTPVPVRGKGVGFALIASVIALSVAVGAGLIAWHALGAANAVGGPISSAPMPELGPSDEYAGESMRLQAGCATAMFLDLDEPRANVAQPAGDLRYDSKCGKDVPSFSLGPGAQGGSQVTGPDVDAPGCDQAIRTSPLGPGARVPAQTGATLCVLTAGAQPHMALVEITDVTRDGTVTLSATSWSVPGR